jgi:hypothetical protein
MFSTIRTNTLEQPNRFCAKRISQTQCAIHWKTGSYLRLTIETVSRSLSALQLAGFIGINQRAIELHDINGLRAIQKTAAPEKLGAKPARAKNQSVTRTKAQRRDHSIWANLAVVA